ncbi:MAG: ferrous iron transport protein A [Eggerthellaceae bacterium]|nr:ferrous iron transport protein A [Eggerthellaceae bacterium]
MTLNTIGVGEKCQLVSCDIPAKTRSKLETLGLVPGELIKIVQSTRAGLIIEVKSSHLAIAHDLASRMTVS